MQTISSKKLIFLLFLTLFSTFLSFSLFSIVLSAPPTSPYRPGETLNPSCSPGDPNCTVSPPLSTYISTTTIIELNNNLLSFNTGTLKILGELIVTNTTTFNGISYRWPSISPNPNQFLQVDNNGNLQWVDISLSTAGGWVDDGNLIRLQTITDSIAIGTTTQIGKFIIATGTINALIIDNDGNVGIGTITPSQKLTVAGNIGISAGMNTFIGTLDNYALSLKTNNTDRIFITNDGKIGIGTTTPEYQLDVVGGLRALSLTANIRVATLTSDITTLTPGVDAMYQWLNPGTSSRWIFLATTTSKVGDRFIIRNNADASSALVLIIMQGSTTLDVISAQSIKEYIFDGINWVAGNETTGIYNKDRNVSIGAVSYGDDSGIAIGYYSWGSKKGVSIGHESTGFNFGVSIGYQSGYNINSNNPGANVLIGAYSGYRLTTGAGNIILGYQSGYDSNYSPRTGSYNILIGYKAWTPSTTTSNFLNIGGLIFGTNLSTTTNQISTGNVGIGTTTPSYKLDVQGQIRQTTAINCSLSADTGGAIICTPSSLEYKNVLGPVNLDINKFLSLSTKRWLWKEEELKKIGISLSGESIGFVAEEIASTVPELVRFDSNNQPIGIKTELLPFYLFETIKNVLNTFTDKVKTSLSQFGILIENSIIKIKELVVDILRVKQIKELETFEMKDKGSGEIYCVWLEYGEFRKIKGSCDNNSFSSTIYNNSNNETNNNTNNNQLNETNNNQLNETINDLTIPQSYENNSSSPVTENSNISTSQNNSQTDNNSNQDNGSNQFSDAENRLPDNNEPPNNDLINTISESNESNAQNNDSSFSNNENQDTLSEQNTSE